jgi:hypothetical protein
MRHTSGTWGGLPGSNKMKEEMDALEVARARLDCELCKLTKKEVKDGLDDYEKYKKNNVRNQLEIVEAEIAKIKKERGE